MSEKKQLVIQSEKKPDNYFLNGIYSQAKTSPKGNRFFEQRVSIETLKQIIAKMEEVGVEWATLSSWQKETPFEVDGKVKATHDTSLNLWKPEPQPEDKGSDNAPTTGGTDELPF